MPGRIIWPYYFWDISVIAVNKKEPLERRWATSEDVLHATSFDCLCSTHQKYYWDTLITVKFFQKSIQNQFSSMAVFLLIVSFWCISPIHVLLLSASSGQKLNMTPLISDLPNKHDHLKLLIFWLFNSNPILWRRDKTNATLLYYFQNKLYASVQVCFLQTSCHTLAPKQVWQSLKSRSEDLRQCFRSRSLVSRWDGCWSVWVTSSVETPATTSSYLSATRHVCVSVRAFM